MVVVMRFISFAFCLIIAGAFITLGLRAEPTECATAGETIKIGLMFGGMMLFVALSLALEDDK